VDAVEIADGEDAAAARRRVLSRPLFGRSEGSDGALRDFGLERRRNGGKCGGGVDAHVELQAVVGHLNMAQTELAQRSLVSAWGKSWAMWVNQARRGFNF